MRAAFSAALLVMFAAPASAESACAYFNQSGQSVWWDGEKQIVFDPLYADKVSCNLVPIPETNGYRAECGNHEDRFVVGLSRPDAPFVDIVVFQDTFFWYRCDKDHA